MSACVSDEVLFYYTEGLLDQDEARETAAHLRECPTCRERHRQETELTVSLRGLPVPAPPQGFARTVAGRIRLGRRERTSRWWWLAAALLAVTPGVVWLLWNGAGAGGTEVTISGLATLLVRAPLGAVQWITSADTWHLVGVTARTLAEALASSPTMLAACFASLGIVALGANYLIWLAARRALRTGR